MKILIVFFLTLAALPSLAYSSWGSEVYDFKCTTNDTMFAPCPSHMSRIIVRLFPNHRICKPAVALDMEIGSYSRLSSFRKSTNDQNAIGVLTFSPDGTEFQYYQNSTTAYDRTNFKTSLEKVGQYNRNGDNRWLLKYLFEFKDHNSQRSIKRYFEIYIRTFGDLANFNLCY